MPPSGISEDSGRIARNTVLLYFRMLVMMVIGLFTSRIILETLGINDFGTYNAVAGVVLMFNVVTASISQAISRYIAFALGKAPDTLHRIFSTSIVIQLIFCAVILLLTETAGLWYLHNVMDIPYGRMGAAGWVLQCAMLTMMLQLLSVPFTAVITAHEDMKAYAWLSILEAGLKLAVAAALVISPADKLKTYAVLMAVVALIVRFSYSAYCHRHYEESRGRLEPGRGLIREMLGFAGWNFVGSTTFIVNTQGVNQLTNYFFGVAMNAARGVAAQVEGIVKQFATNIAMAINPQITKSYAAGRTDYTHELVCKGGRYYFLILLTVSLPLCLEAPILLDLWLKDVPGSAVLFTRLTLIALMADFTGNTLTQLAMATGKVRRYYIITGAVTITVFPITWMLFLAGAPAWVPYVVFAAVYALLIPVKLLIMKKLTGLSPWRYIREVLFKGLAVAVPSAALAIIPWHFMPQSVWRMLTVTAVSTAAIGLTTWLFALTPGEKDFVKSRIFSIFTR